MYTFGEKHPVAFELVLIIISFAAAALFSIAGNVFSLHPDFSASVGRIIVAAALLIIFSSNVAVLLNILFLCIRNW